MTLRRARTAEEYAEWVKQALFEVEDLRNCLEYELDELGRFPGYLEPLEESVRELYDSMAEGRYLFGREDLPFMAVLARYADQIPFQELLKQINETHRRGLDVDGSD